MNPEDTNGAGQNVATQNPSQPNQNMMNQSATFPDQNSQPVQSPFVQDSQLAQTPLVQNPQPIQATFAQNPPSPTSPLAPSPKSKKPIWIACIVGVLALVTIGVVCFVVMQGDNNPAGDVADNPEEGVAEGVGPNVVGDVPDVMDVEKFKQMTKAEAMALLEVGRNKGGSMPKNYVGEEITDLIVVENNVVLSDVKLKYSHETIDDLRQMAEDWYGVLGHNDGITEDDYEIREYDYYAIVIPTRTKGDNTCDYDYYGSCNSLLSFKRDYLNYYQEETSPNSYTDVAYIDTQNPELVERLLRIESLFPEYGIASAHGAIYGSSFEERDDMFVLTVYHVSVGLDMEKLKTGGSDIGYAINLYSRQYAADKADGRLHRIRTGENSTVNNFKSIPVTEAELSSLFGYDV